MKKIILILAVSFVVSCAAGSGSIRWDDARQLKVGMTESEVVETIGKPYSVASMSDGTEKWIWVHVNLLMGTQTLSLKMKDSKVIEVPRIPDSFK